MTNTPPSNSSPTMSDSESTEASIPTYCTLQVQHLENVKWKSKFHRQVRRFYVEVRLGDIVQKSEKARILGTPTSLSTTQYRWDEVFPFSTCAHDTRVLIKIKHESSYKSDPCIGYIETELAELLDGQQSVPLRKGPTESSSVTATLFLKLEVSDAKQNADAALDNLKASLTRQNRPKRRSVRAGVEKTGDQEAEQDRFETMRATVPNIDQMATVMAELSNINPDLSVAWKQTLALYSAVSKRFDAGRVIYLMGKLFTTFGFVRVEEHLGDILENMSDSILRIFDMISRLCIFIRDYDRRNLATRRVIRSIGMEKIDDIEDSLEQLKIDLEDSFIIQIMATSTSKPLSSTTALYSLDVEYCGDSLKQRRFFNQKSQLYVGVRLSDVLEGARSQSIQEDTSESLKHTFSLVSSNPSSRLTIELIQEKPFTRKISRIAIHTIKLDELLEQCQTNKDGLTIDCPSGSMLLILKEIDKITSATIKVRNTGKNVGTGRLSQAIGFTADACGFISSQGKENGDLYRSAGQLLLKLDVFVKVVGDISAISPHLSLVWSLASAVYKLISHQLQMDARVASLLGQLEEKFEFVRETASLRNKTFFLKSAIEKLLKITEDCCDFIKRYFERPFAERMVKVGEEQIRSHESSLVGLTSLFRRGEEDYQKALETQSRLKIKLDPSDMDAYGRPSCLKDTQVGARRQIRSWLTSGADKPVLWLHGVAGSGKSTIANTIARELQTGQLGAYLFFERTKSKPEKVVRTMAYQLAKSNPVIAKHIEDFTVEHFSSFKDLIIDPLKIAAPYIEGFIVIILDALDECGQTFERRELLDALEMSFLELPSKVRILITSRPEPDLRNVLSDHESVLSIELDHTTKASRDDVSKYFTHEMDELFKPQDMKKQVPIDWAWEMNVRRLADIANGLFIWASTAVKYIRLGKDAAFERLAHLVVDAGSENHIGLGINELYATILDNIELAWDNPNSRLRFSRVLYLILTLDLTLSTDDIDTILGLSSSTSSHLILSRLQSVLTYKPGSRRSRIRPFHASFADFLTSPSHSNKAWFVDIPRNEEYLNQRCLDSFGTMERLLRFNICGIKSSFKENTGEGQLQYSIEDRIPPCLRDACLSWAQQLRVQPFSAHLLERLSFFLYHSLLFWLEVLSLIERVDAASDMLLDALRWVLGNRTSLESFLRHARELVSISSSAIANSLPHIYLSMIPLATKGSQMAEHYSQFISPITEIDMTGDRPEAALSSVLKLENSRPSRIYYSVSYSFDARQIVAGSDDDDVTVWDSESGEVIAGPLKGHTGTVKSVAFSPDGKWVVSGSYDDTIRLWDVEKAEAVLILKGHTGDVNSVAVSPDGKLIVSGSDDCTLRIWNAMSGKSIVDPIQAHESAILSVAFSPDGKRIASGSADETVRIWDTLSGRMVKGPFGWHTGSVLSIAYSPDGKHIASVSEDKTILVYHVDNGQVVLGPLKGHEGAIYSVAYSPNGDYIVSGSRDGTIRAWTVNGGNLVSVKRHAGPVLSVGISPDSRRVVSSSYYGEIQIQDIEGSEGGTSSFEGQTASIKFVTFLPGSRCVVSGSSDDSICVWDMKYGKLVLGPLEEHSSYVESVTSSPIGKYVVTGLRNGTVKVWNADTGQLVRNVRVARSVLSVSVSPDGKRIAAGSDDGSVYIMDLEKRSLRSLKGHADAILSICFSPDGRLIASGSRDETLRVWNVQSGEVVSGPLKGHTGDITTVVFLLDGKRVLSSSIDKTVRIWDVKSGQLVADLFKGQVAFLSISLSPDEKHIVSGSKDGSITVWNVESGSIFAGPFTGHSKAVNSVAYSSDGKHIVSGSDDRTIKVWDVENEVASSAVSRNPHTSWTLSEDGGWILGQDGELLVWLPPDIRPGLWRPRNTTVFNTPFTTKLRFMECGMGESWEECFDHIALAARKENSLK